MEEGGCERGKGFGGKRGKGGFKRGSGKGEGGG